MCDSVPKPLFYTYSKTFKVVPIEHMESHRYLNQRKFVPSYEKPCAPQPNMYHLLGWQYYRIWRCEVTAYLAKRDKHELTKFIKPDVNCNRDRFAELRKAQAKRAKPPKNAMGAARIDNKGGQGGGGGQKGAGAAPAAG